MGSLALPFPFCSKHIQLSSLGLEARRAGVVLSRCRDFCEIKIASCIWIFFFFLEGQRKSWKLAVAECTECFNSRVCMAEYHI